MGRTGRWIAIGMVILSSAIALIVGTKLLWDLFFTEVGPAGMVGPRSAQLPSQPFESNGQRIYFTGSSRTGPPVRAQMAGMHRMAPGRMACVTCHGPDGRGGTVRMMMDTFEAPNIRWAHLTEEGHHDTENGDEVEEHPPYSERTIRQAITQGVNPAGQELNWAMPRWKMTESQLDDLVSYLKTLE